MELQDFISDTLLSICRGIAAAQQELARTGEKGAINPVWGGHLELENYVSEVGFDVAVTASDSTSGKGPGGVKVVALSLEAGTQKEKKNESVSKIQFKVRFSAPATMVDG